MGTVTEQWMEGIDGQEPVCMTVSASSTRADAINIRNALHHLLVYILMSLAMSC